MNTPIDKPSFTLRPCPYCGKTDTLKIASSEELYDEDGQGIHTEYWAVQCDASKPVGPGGCGASGGYKPTHEEAAANWNRRACSSDGAISSAVEAMELALKCAEGDGWDAELQSGRLPISHGAHAVVKLRDAIAAIKAIEEHNAGCRSSCGKTSTYPHVVERRKCDSRRDCTDCPLEWLVEWPITTHGERENPAK